MAYCVRLGRSSKMHSLWIWLSHSPYSTFWGDCDRQHILSQKRQLQLQERETKQKRKGVIICPSSQRGLPLPLGLPQHKRQLWKNFKEIGTVNPVFFAQIQILVALAIVFKRMRNLLWSDWNRTENFQKWNTVLPSALPALTSQWHSILYGCCKTQYTRQ